MRRIQELRGEIDLERGVARSPPRKRLGEEQESLRNRRKKWKYPPLEDDWGENISPQDGPAPSNSPDSPGASEAPALKGPNQTTFRTRKVGFKGVDDSTLQCQLQVGGLGDADRVELLASHPPPQ